MSRIRILHISDIHLTNQGEPIWGVDTMGNFHRLIECIKQHSQIDAIIISGDISNDGSEWSYKYADDTFRKLGIPTYWCMGNHDSYSNFNSIPTFCKTSAEFSIDKYRLLLLNSVIPDEDDPTHNKSRGKLSNEQLQQIRLATSKYENIIIVLHHPVIELNGWLDRRILDNRAELKELLDDSKSIRLVMYGHIHCHTMFDISGIVYTSAPAVSYAYSNDLPKFQIDEGNEGYNLITIENGLIKITTFNL